MNIKDRPKPTKAEETGLKRFMAQRTMFLTAEQLLEDAYRAGFRDGSLVKRRTKKTDVKAG